MHKICAKSLYSSEDIETIFNCEKVFLDNIDIVPGYRVFEIFRHDAIKNFMRQYSDDKEYYSSYCIDENGNYIPKYVTKKGIIKIAVLSNIYTMMDNASLRNIEYILDEERPQGTIIFLSDYTQKHFRF